MRKVNKLWILAPLLFISFSRQDRRDVPLPEQRDMNYLLPAPSGLQQDSGQRQCCLATPPAPTQPNEPLLHPGSGISTSIL